MPYFIWNPFMIPIVGTIAGTAMIVLIVAIVFWYKNRERELQVHQEMRIREMEHSAQNEGAGTGN